MCSSPDDIVKGMISDLVKKYNSDVVIFNGQIEPSSEQLLHEIINQKSHPNVYMILVTYGGDPDIAYEIGRGLQRNYEEITICISGDCYSAGTLIALSANRLVICDKGKLGPLDIQRTKKDEIIEWLSGLTIDIALKQLNKQATEALEYTALQLKANFNSLSFKTALDIAANMVSTMYGQIYRQIDPIMLGDDSRALQIAGHYGKRLGKHSNNLKDGAINRLLHYYPSHTCIIDRDEAKELFNTVEQPSELEVELLKRIGDVVISARTVNSPFVITLGNIANREEPGIDLKEATNLNEELTDNTELHTEPCNDECTEQPESDEDITERDNSTEPED